jgi:outer membrane receptor protein involved in Fe transport
MLSVELPFRLFLVVALLCLSVAIVQAQSTSATLSGTVTDENGAVVPGANVTVTNPATGVQRQATTSGEGAFNIPLLPPSTYTILVERQGFATAKLSDVVLHINDNVSLNIQLKVGQISGETVNVNDVSMVETSPSVSTVIDRESVQNLPLNGRSFQSLITLTPGTVLARTGSFNRGQFSVNGQRTNSNYFTVDGVSANIGVSAVDSIGEEAAGSLPGFTAGGGTNNLVSVDALQEFRIQTSTYAPEFGRTPGAQVSLITRSGGRDFHATLFEYFRNDALDANDYFANRAGLPRARLRQNQFGGVISGPIILPRFGEGGRRWYNGRNHSFFFFSYEGLRLRQPQTSVTTVPSLRLRSIASPSIRFLLDAFPLPTGPEIGTSGRAPFNGTYSDQSTLDATSIRIDHNFSDKLSLFSRYNIAPSEGLTRLVQTPSQLTSIKMKTQTLTLGATQTLSASAINEVRFNYSRSSGANIRSLDSFGGAIPVTAQQIAAGAPAGLQPATIVQFANGSYTAGQFNDNLQRQINILDNFSYILNSHNLKFGFDYRRLTPVYRARDYQAAFLFLDEPAVRTGLATVAQVLGIQSTRPVFNNFSLYAQDTWQASKRLSLTYGVRWDVNPPPGEAQGRRPFVISSNDPLTAGLAASGTPLWKTTYNNLAPRAGLSYQLSQKPGQELVLRGGIGLFYDLGNTQGGDAYTSGRFRTISNTLFGVPFPLTAAQAQLPPFPPETDARRTQPWGFDPNLKLPYTWQWNVAVERSLGTNQSFSAAYVGAIARRLLRQRRFSSNPNFAVLQYVDNGATSDYNSMQLQFTRRLSNNFQALASYTWSHSIDETSSDVGFELARRGNSDFDVRHNFSSALLFNMPWKPSGFAGLLLRGWQAQMIIHAQSAYPITPFTQSVSTLNGLVVSILPDLVEGVPLYTSDPLVAGGRRLNRAAFRDPAAGTQGSLGRNIVRGFPIYQIDLGFQRLFVKGEHFRLTLRAEAFNLFNHPNFATPVADLSSPLFGQSTQMLGRSFGVGGLSPIYQLGGPRSIQLGVRLEF